MADPEILGTTAPTSVGERYWPALDGLRAVAVLLVIALHCNLSWASGGFIGVDIFFVLSGFLITTVLVSEWERFSRIGLGRFYLRRILRLYPALLLALFGGVLIASWVGSDEVRSIPSALTYWMNWWQIDKRTGVLGPLWSLSVEEQFYLVWPLVLIAALHFGKRFAFCATVALGFLFFLLVATLSSGWSASRLYYGTDARAPQLLVGAAIGLAYSIRPPTGGSLRAVRIAAIVGTVFLVVAAMGVFDTGSGTVPAMPYAASLAIAVAAATVIACLINPPRWCGAVLGSRPAIGIGRISYGIYLWHLAVLYAMREVRPGLRPLFLFIGATAVCIAIAWVSYRLVELRFLRLKRRLTR